MQKLKKKLIWISIFIFSFISYQCKGPASLRTVPNVDLSINGAYNFAVKEHVFSNITIKYNSVLERNSKKHNVTGYIKIASDSSCLINVVSRSLGIEIARIKCKHDSLYIIDRINKTYYEGNYDYLSKKLGYKVNYNFIKSILLGELYAYTFDYSIDNYTNFLAQEKDSIYLYSHSIDSKNDSTIGEFNNANISHKFILNKQGNLLKSKYVNVSDSNLFQISYSNYYSNIPQIVNLIIKSSKFNSDFNLYYREIDFKVDNMVYKVPSSYIKIL